MSFGTDLEAIMPVTNIESTWSSGSLIFFEKAVGRSTTGDVLTIGTTAVTVGNSAQDIDFKVFMGASDQYVLFDVGNAKVTFAKVDVEIDGDLTIDLEDLLIGDGQSLEFGDSADITFTFTDGTALAMAAAASDENFTIGDDTYKINVTLKGALTVGKSDTGHDVIFYGATAANYLQWDESEDDLLLKGTATQFAIEGTTNATSTTTGSLRTAGGAAIAQALWVGGLIHMDNDMALTLGTTTATAETKITLEFDETTTGIGLFNMGSTSAPMVLNTNPGATVIGHTISINHSAGAGDCDDLIASYDKINVVGDGDSGLTIVGHASRAYVGLTGGANNSVASQAYGSQPWAKHEGTGAITAMSALSAKLDVSADNFTATTINAGHFHIEGAATVTGQFDGIMIEVYPDVTSMDSALAIAVDSGAAVVSGIRVSGALTNLLELANGSGCTHGGAAAAAVQGYITVSVGGDPYRIPYLANSDS